MPVVLDIDAVDECKELFVKIGYEYLGEFGIAGRRYLQKGGDERTHHIHIFEQSNKKDIERHIAVRDYLITHEEYREQYGRLKTELAKKYPYSNDDYCDGKEALVCELEQKALAWENDFSLDSN